MQALAAIRQELNASGYAHLPLVADIHFDYRIALRVADLGVDCLRINPGNIGREKRIRAVVDKSRDLGIPIRIGVNAGSLEKDIQKKYPNYHCRPVAPFGDPNAHFLVVGLAPGMRGANRSSKWLMILTGC